MPAIACPEFIENSNTLHLPRLVTTVPEAFPFSKTLTVFAANKLILRKLTYVNERNIPPSNSGKEPEAHAAKHGSH